MLVLQCVVPKCQRNSDTVFKFPTQQEKREKWFRALEMDVNTRFSGPSGVCEAHFHPGQITRSAFVTRLTHFAVPSRCLTESSTETNDDIDAPTAKKPRLKHPNNIDQSTRKSMSPCPTLLEPAVQNETASESTMPFEPVNIKIEADKVENSNGDPVAIRANHKNGKNLKNSASSCKVIVAKARLNHQIKIRKGLETQAKELDDEIAELRKNIKQRIKIENKMSEIREIYNKPEMNIPNMIFKRFMNESDDQDQPFPEDFKKFCIEVCTRSPDAYEFLEKSFFSLLPNLSDVRQWKESIE